MTEIIAAVAGIIGTIIVSVFTYFMARRAGIGPYQDTLVGKLKTLVDVQEKEITALKEDKSLLEDRVSDLEKRVEELEQLTIAQALVIDRLKPQPTRRKRVTPTNKTQESDI